MPITRVLALGGLNIYLNPFLKNDGDLIRSVNLDSYPYGAKSRRSGYVSFLGTADGQQVNSLFSWYNPATGTLNLYRASGSSIYYSVGGTGDWTLAGNGTISNGAHVGYGAMGTVLMVGDGVGSTRHTGDGINFTNTTIAPIASQFTPYQQRMYAMGTASTIFYSTTGDATNWSLSGTADSSSLDIPGAGKLLSMFKSSDRVIATKTDMSMYRWDGYSLVDTVTTSGASSPYSIAEKEGVRYWLNRDGVQRYDGVKPNTISNAVQGQIYNKLGSAVSGTQFSIAPGETFLDDYYLSLGTITEDYTREQIQDAVLKYNTKQNEFSNYRFANFPTAWHSYIDNSGVSQLIFGDATGQCYQLSGTAMTDNGVAISSVQEYSIHMDAPEIDKKWIWFTGFFNPGCEATIQISASDYFDKDNMKWVTLGDAKSGFVEYRFPVSSRSKFLFVKVTDSSKTAPLVCYGFTVEADPIKK